MDLLFAPARLAGYNCFDQALHHVRARATSDHVRIDLSRVTFARPNGIAQLFLVAATLREEGRIVDFTVPGETILTYMQRCGAWKMLERAGFVVPAETVIQNEGRAASLIECSPIPLGRDGHENARLVDASRFRHFLERHEIPAKSAPRIWMEICSNAAEHSRAQLEHAYVFAQAFPKIGELEIAVVDSGIGIPQSLRTYDFADDARAVHAAVTSQDVTGRVDAAGNPMDGGYGLPDALKTSDRLSVRSGRGSVVNVNGVRDGGGSLRATVLPCERLTGTLVCATFLFPPSLT